MTDDRVSPKIVYAGECKRRDCAANRKIITSRCTVCGKELEEGVRYYLVLAANFNTVVAHAACWDNKP